MEYFLAFCLLVHIISGSVSLLSGLLAISTKKGSKIHRFSGRIFFTGMNIVSASALLIAGFKLNQFLFMIGIFSFFQNYMGFRATRNKGMNPGKTDWIVLAVAGINSVMMLITGNIVLLVFGLICTGLVVGQLRIYIRVIQRKEIKQVQWLAQHIAMMMGAFIATITAFLVVNVKNFEPGWVIWIAPSVIGGALISYHTRKVLRKSPSQPAFSGIVLLFLLTGSGSLSGLAQPYTEGGNTRHRFAQLNLGMGSKYFLAGRAEMFHLEPDGSTTSYNPGEQADLRFIIGGTHFWGHADFYISIPVWDISRSGFAANVETGAKYYPWRIQHKRLSPYIGSALLPVVIYQESGTRQMRFRYPLTGGVTYCHKNQLIDLDFGYLFNKEWDYYLSPSVAATFTNQRFWISLNYKFMLETTLSAEKDWKSGKTQKLTDTLASLKALNGITVAAGPSSAFFTRESSYNSELFPFLGQHKASNLFLDLGLGYYFHNPDLQLNLAWRSNQSELSAYGYLQTAKRQSLCLEAFKFISDFHGFAAYIGPTISYEWLSLREEKPAGTTSETRIQGIRPGVIFGWDIRPNRLQAILLRTNLRYFPLINIKEPNGYKFAFDQLEFNFIQVVIFPNRLF